MRRTRPLALVLLVASVALVPGCGRDGAGLVPVSPPASGAASWPSGDESAPGSDLVGVSEIPPADREPAPAIEGETLSGGRFSVADQGGKVVVVNNWASWCAPCRQEIPELRRTFDATDRADVVIAGLNVTDSPDAAQAFVEETGIAWDSIVDPDGAVLATIPGVPPRSLPSTVVIDRQGRIAARIVGPIQPGVLDAIVERVSAEPA